MGLIYCSLLSFTGCGAYHLLFFVPKGASCIEDRGRVVLKPSGRRVASGGRAFSLANRLLEVGLGIGIGNFFALHDSENTLGKKFSLSSLEKRIVSL